jgi:hypothetical protein
MLERVAGLVSDGDAVDWFACARGAAHDERRWLDHLRILSAVQRVARSGAVGESEPTIAVTPAAARAAAGAPMAATPLPAWGELQPLERLGSGGFGDVYRAWDTRLHRQVALKLHRTDVRGGRDGDAAIQEARLLARTEHPHVVRIYGIDTHDGRTGIWMELVHGMSLHTLVVEQGAMQPDAVARIGIDLCAALEAVHAAGVVHQDLKPQNIMRETSSGRIVLMDFGAGRWRGRDAGAVAGTPQFMAPEVAAGLAPSPQSDLYAVGVVLQFLSSGGAAGAPRDLGPLGAVIARAMAPDRGRRYESAGEMRAALESVLDASVVEATAASPRPMAATAGAAPADATGASRAVSSRGWRSWRPVAVAAALAVLVGVGALAWRMRSGGGAALNAEAQFVEVTSGRNLNQGDTIGPQDRVQITLQPSESVYVYVLNVDQTGAATLMFPMQGGGPTNPLAAGVLHRLPSERLGWTFSADAGFERFMIVASRTRLAEFETELANLPQVTLGGGLTARPLGTDQVAVLMRGVTGVAQVPAPTAAPSVDALFGLAQQLAVDSNVWLREMRLRNRGG